ncbi:MAG: hypothetical protein NTY48_04020 [Candidatus Diapherotrites archaeon]|nr:hypothetical protein [Candidatus Diapherotrites archaeon]
MHEGLKEIAGTKFIISGRRLLDLNEPESMDLIVRKGVKQVFMIFMGEVLDKGYSEHKQEIEQKLIERGIQFIPLPKDPENIGPLEAFSRNVSKLKPNEKALVQCYHGLHKAGVTDRLAQ